MPLISIITAVHPGSTAYLYEALESIAAQTLRPGWGLEWLVQEDGPESSLGDSLMSACDWIRYDANGAHLGIAGTRNLALARAGGDLIQNLDSDDVLLPGALDLISRFESQDIHWAIGQADDLLPDGSRKSFPSLLPFGYIAPGSVNNWAEEHGGNWPVHCAGLMMRTASLRAVGGYAGLPYDDDVVMFAALSQAVAGWWDERHTWLYRQHPDQTTRNSERNRWSEACRRIALQRARAVRFSGMSLAAVQASTHDVEVGQLNKTGLTEDQRRAGSHRGPQ